IGAAAVHRPEDASKIAALKACESSSSHTATALPVRSAATARFWSTQLHACNARFEMELHAPDAATYRVDWMVVELNPSFRTHTTTKLPAPSAATAGSKSV